VLAWCHAAACNQVVYVAGTAPLRESMEARRCCASTPFGSTKQAPAHMSPVSAYPGSGCAFTGSGMVERGAAARQCGIARKTRRVITPRLAGAYAS